MAGLFLVREDGRTKDRMCASAAQFAAGGFAPARALAIPGWRVAHYPPIIGGPPSFLEHGADWIAVAGTPSVDGAIGEPALRALLQDMPLPAIDWSRVGGHFIALVKRGPRAFLFADAFAAFQLFHDEEWGLFSTSLLGALAALPRVRFDAQGIYEFAFNVVPIGDDTVFADLKTLGPGEIVELTADGTMLHAAPFALPAETRRAPLAQRIAAGSERLAAAVTARVAHFGDRIHCPLSGGLDSRLVLAALRAAGARPHVYVYGPDRSTDVTVAQAIGAAEGFAVDWVNKDRLRTLAPDEFAEQTARNFAEFDALPTYGNIFDNGGHAAARDRRHADGWLAASGGCGEVYRDFFYLPACPLKASHVARSFFARFAAADTTAAFDPRIFLDRITAKLLAAVDRDRDVPLPRTLIEQLYPRVRCRALFGREISLEARYGSYFMPFLEPAVVAEALTLPMSLKHAGRYEATLLAAIDPALARHRSAYGHDFAGPPSLGHRLGEWSSRLRPTWVRERSYAIQRRLRPLGDEHGGLLAPEYMGRVIDLDMPAMRRFFHIERIGDSGLWRRLAALEYLAGWLGSKLVS